MHPGRPLLLLLAAAAGLWYYQKQQGGGSVAIGPDGNPILDANGKPISIGRVGADITTNDTRGDAIAKGIAALLGDPFSQGTIQYEDSDINLTFQKGMDVAGEIFGPRLGSAPLQGDRSSFGLGVSPMWRFYKQLATSNDPAARRAAWLYSWTTPGTDYNGPYALDQGAFA